MDNPALTHEEESNITLEGKIEQGIKDLALMPVGHPDLHGTLDNLAALYYKKYTNTGIIDDLDHTIKYELRLRMLTPDEHPGLPQRLAMLAASCNIRYMRSNSLSDLKQAIGYETQAYLMTAEGHHDFSVRLASLGSLHFRQFKHLGDPADLDKAIELQAKAVSIFPEGHPTLPFSLNTLAQTHNQRFERLGDPGDLNKAIEYQTRAHLLLPEKDSASPAQLSQLSSLYCNRFRYLGDLGDLTKAIEYQTQANSALPEGDPGLPANYGNLGVLYQDKYKRLGVLADLNHAIEVLTRAHTLAPEGHPYSVIGLENLGAAYSKRFERLGNLDDMNMAIDLQTKAYSLTPKEDPDLPIGLGKLATSYYNRFRRFGNLDDLQKAIEFQTQAYSLTPQKSHRLPARLSRLASFYHNRCMRLGSLSDLTRALEFQTQAHSLTNKEHPQFPIHLGALGSLYSNRFKHLGDLDDLNLAIGFQTQACSLTPEGHPELPAQLGMLGLSYRQRFGRTGDLGDLSKAIEYDTRAYILTPPGHPEILNWLSKLGQSYFDRFVHLGKADDLNQAIDYETKAYSLTPEGHADLPERLVQLGILYCQKSLSEDEPTFRNQAIDYFRKASCSSVGHPRDRYNAALHLARTSLEYGYPGYLSAYHRAIELIPELVWLGTTVGQRYVTLEQMRNVAIEAASVALRDSQPELALEWLEQGRSIVWNQTLHLRSPLDGLRAHHPTLAEKLQNVRSELHNVSLQGPESLPGSGDWLTPEHAAQRQHLLATEYTNLISEVQQLPGFSHFLRPKPASELILAARRGTVIVINVHETQCDALVIRPGSPKIDFLNLPNFTQQRAHDMCMHMEASIGRSGIKERTERRPIQSGQDIQRDLKHTLSVLWDYIVEPVLRLLGYIATTPEQLPHITWCTTGPLSFIPLHAAGYYDRPECKLSDYAVSSYTPTLSALIALDLTPSDHRSIIAIGQEITPGFSRLPGTVTELGYIKQHAGNSIQYHQLTESNATPAAVLEQMERHDWVHLACHAHQNITDPRMSGFFLHGGILDLSKITEKEFTNKGLAFLSACQTATGDRKLADEAVHLASGLLIAGYPAVIATMWAVGDSDASFVANKIYQNLFKDGKMEYEGAARALHYAIVELREEIGEDRIECWAPFIHIGSY